LSADPKEMNKLKFSDHRVHRCRAFRRSPRRAENYASVGVTRTHTMIQKLNY